MNTGVDLIKSVCKPLESILTHKSIGHLLQFIHLFGYLSILFFIYYFPVTRPYCMSILGIILLMFYAFDGCILTKAEMYYLDAPITTPGLFLDMLGIRPTNKEIDKKAQRILSLLLLSAPIIYILLKSSRVNSMPILNNVGGTRSSSL